MRKTQFTAGVERLINPITVGTLHFLQGYNQMLPVSVQNKIIENSAKENPYMGFVVEPYCTFLFQKITDLEFFEEQLPSNFKIVKTSPFVNEEPDYYVILSLFNARTSAFFGSRVEAYLIAENQDTGLTSWIIIDYITTTISHDPKFGLTHPSVKQGFVSTDFSGNVVAQMNDEHHQTELRVATESGVLKDLDPILWIEGNLSVSYGLKYDSSGKTFGLMFDKREMSTALDISIDQLSEYKNDWFSGHVEPMPEKIVVFKYAQHFISDSPGNYSNISSIDKLDDVVAEVDFNSLKAYSTEKMSKKFQSVPVFLTAIIIVLIILLVNK